MKHNDCAVSIDLTDAYLHVLIHPQSRKYLRFVNEDQVFHFTALPFGMSLSVDFHETDGRYSSVLTPTCHISLPVPRRLVDKRSDSQSIGFSDKILYTNNSKSRFSSKSKEIGITSHSEFHIHRHGISDSAKFIQGPSGSSRDPYTDNQINPVMQTSIGTNFPFSFGQTQCRSRFCSPSQTSRVPWKCVFCLSGDLTFFLSIIRFRSPVWFDLIHNGG